MRDPNVSDGGISPWINIGQVWIIEQDPKHWITIGSDLTNRLKVWDKFIIKELHQSYDGDINWVHIIFLNGAEATVWIRFFEHSYFRPLG